MTRSAPKRSPHAPHVPAAAGAVLVAADFEQSLVWIRFDGEEKIAIGLAPDEARALARALSSAAQEVDAGRIGPAGGLIPV